MRVVKVSEVSGQTLDWLVATCEGYIASITESDEVVILREGVTDYFDPHRNWGWAGLIIEREHINLRTTFTEGGYRTSQSSDAVCAKIDLPNDSTVFDPLKVVQEYGPTPLIAAMRCYVVSKLGETAEVPEELFKSVN